LLDTIRTGKSQNKFSFAYDSNDTPWGKVSSSTVDEFLQPMISCGIIVLVAAGMVPLPYWDIQRIVNTTQHVKFAHYMIHLESLAAILD
jgi:hypothetical protein